MSALQPTRIVLHCGLHKTGSTYLQRNLQSNRGLLLKHGVLYLGPNTLKKQCRDLWSFLQWGVWNQPPSATLRGRTQHALLELAGDQPGSIHTILISFESIFGTLRTGLIKAGRKRKKPANRESRRGLYRYARPRTKRLMIGLEQALSVDDIHWRIVFASREPTSFARSCHTQLIKEGHDLSGIAVDEFVRSSDFSDSTPEALNSSLSKLANKRRLEVIDFRYEDHISADDPTLMLWAVLERALPEQAHALREALETSTENANLQQQPNPGLSERGLELATQARPLFNKQEWKLFRKFLEKNFTKTS
ncbi:hypothetical protein [Parasynechococcus sp.]|uniref:hypothetical protein n=1 Tax=Parasynechococcus sp. TaxID=3101203 RepID=UPI003703EECB